MLHFDKSLANPFQQIHAPEIPDLTNELFRAYLCTNGIESEELSRQIVDLFKDISPQSDAAEIYTSTHAFDERLGKINGAGTDLINSYFHLASVAQEIRRQMVRRQLNNNMLTELQQREFGAVDPNTPLPYGSYEPNGFAEWFFPHIDRNGNIREALIKSPDKLVDVLERIEPEYVLTQHPTNSNPVALNRIIADMVTAGLEMTMPSRVPLEEAGVKLAMSLRKFKTTPRIPKGNFTVNDEVSLSNNSAGNFFAGRSDDLATIIRLAKARFGNDFTREHQIRVAKGYHVKLGDWAASDDDGNDNIKAEHRLYKLVKQRLGMVRHYKAQYHELAGGGHVFAQQREDELNKIESRLLNVDIQFKDNDEFKSAIKPDGDIVLSEEKFAEMSRQINLACLSVTDKNFKDYSTQLQTEAETQYTQNKSRQSDMPLLQLVNDLENSGLYGYHNELRKNCAFNREALIEVLKFVPGLKNIEVFNDPPKDADDNEKIRIENERISILDKLVVDPQTLRYAAEQMLQKAKAIIETDRDYNNPLVKAYHTIQSLSLTQQHSDCYDNFVLAETENPSDILTSMALQVAGQSSKFSAKPHWLHIIPLFETEESLKNYNTVMFKTLSTNGFRKLLVSLAEQGKRSAGKVGDLLGRLQIMFAHSDGWRLAGRIAADGLLAVARLSKWGLAQFENFSIGWGGQTIKLIVEKYHGLSLSDPSRSGGRDQIGMIDDTYAARHPKKTIQGVDQANHLNSATSAARMIGRDITKAVKVILGASDIINLEREMLVAESARDTAGSYTAEHFEGSMPAKLRHPFWNYNLHNLITNFSSRLSARKKTAAQIWVKVPTLPNLEGSRAISVSNSFFYGSTVNIYYATRRYVQNLAYAVSGNPKIIAEITADGSQEMQSDGKMISPRTAAVLNDDSKEFHRNVDKITQGLCLTDMVLERLRMDWGETQGIPAAANDVTPEQRLALYDEYIQAARLASIALRGEELPVATEPTLENVKAIAEYLRTQVLPMDDRDYLRNLSAVGMAIHDRLIADSINEMEPKGETVPRDIVMHELRVLDGGINRARGPRLDVNDIAEAGVITRAKISLAPKFAKLIAA